MNAPASVFLEREVDRCQPWIEAALERSARSHAFQDVKALILSGGAHLWSTADGCLVTCFIDYPLSKTTHIWLCGGDFEQVYTTHAEDIYRWARQHECDQIVVNGRKGWERRLKNRGYEFKAVVLIKEI